VFNPGLELYHDFYSYYVVQLHDLSQGMFPYKDFAYSYPPLFLYTLYPFYLLGGQYGASIPIWIADAATAPVVYLIVKMFSNSRISIVAGLVYAVSPLFLLYEGYLWLSSQPMTFFLLLSVYLLLVKRPMISFAMLAISILFKQEIILVLPIFAIWYLKNTNRVSYKPFALITAFVLVVSLPFLVIAPTYYVSSVSYGTLGNNLPAPLIQDLPNQRAAPTVPQTGQSLVCSSESSTWRSLVCSYGNFTYTDIKSVPSISVFLSAAFLNTIAPWISALLFALTGFYLFLNRHKKNTLLMSSALLLTGFVAIFDFDIHSIYRYYLIPVYALILSSTDNRASLIISALASLITLILPSGSVQLLPPLSCILIILISSYVRTMKEIGMKDAQTNESAKNTISLNDSFDRNV